MTDRAGAGRLDVITVESEQIQLEMLPGVGGRLHRLRAFGHDLLRTPADPATHLRDPFMWGAYVMAPWCNRIAALPTDVDGRWVRVPANFGDGSAIHGEVSATQWQLETDGTLRVRAGGGAWPWPYEAALRVTVRDATVVIAQTLTNRAETAMPAGLGLHPWFRAPVQVRIEADRVLPDNVDPNAQFEPVAGSLDLRDMTSMPAELDATWGGIGDPAVGLRWPELGVMGTMRARSTGGLFVVAASPSQIDAVAIEPQTNAPQGLRRYLRGQPGGLTAMAPGAMLQLEIQLSLSLDDTQDAAYHA